MKLAPALPIHKVVFTKKTGPAMLKLCFHNMLKKVHEHKNVVRGNSFVLIVH